MPYTPILIIGAGPAGLAMAARLKKHRIQFEIIERHQQVAHSWTQHYKRLHLHSAKSTSSLPYIPFPKEYPQYVSRQQVVDYCADYAINFDIRPHFGQQVLQVRKLGQEQKWLVEIQDAEDWTAGKVVIATGLNQKPKVPHWPGDENFKGELIHSRSYFESEPYRNKNVLVVGMGNTGAEIALDLTEAASEVAISVRSPQNIVPLNAFGRSTQRTALLLEKLPPLAQDVLSSFTRWATIGKLDNYGIQTAPISPMKQLRTTGKSPTIDLGTVQKIKQGKIRIKPGISEFKEDQVVFTDSSSEAFDAVILATGYRSAIGELVPAAREHLDQYGNPHKSIGSGKLQGLYFLGFDNYRAGGILGIINRDSSKILDDIRKSEENTLEK